MLKLLAVLSLALGVAASGVSAQTGDLITNPRGMVQNFDAAHLGPVLTELGLVWQERTGDDGTRFIAVSLAGKLSFNIVPTACLAGENGGCVGANILAFYSGGKINHQTVSAFNQKYAFISAGLMANNAGAYISRYEIADYGIPRGNVASSLSNFVFLAERFGTEISSATQTVSQEGFADDLSARRLNALSGGQIGVAAPRFETVAAIHQAGFEATPELVRALMASDSAPQNKIRNLTK